MGIYFLPFVALPLCGEKSNPFFSLVKDWVNPKFRIFTDEKNLALFPRKKTTHQDIFFLISID
jgi:hypothetical protein